MRKLAWILSTLFTLVIVAAIGLVVFVLTIDPNQYKPEIERLAAAQGVELELAGDLSWQLYPAIAIEAGQVRLRRDEAGDLLQLDADYVAANLQLLPLLRRQVQIDGVVLRGATVDYSTSGEPAPAGDAAADDAAPPALELRRIEIDDTGVTYRNRATGEQVELGIASLQLSGIDLDGGAADVSGQITFDYRAPDQALVGNLEIDASAALGDLWTVQLNELRGGVRQLPDAELLPIAASGRIEWDPAAQRGTFDLPQLALAGATAQLRGNAALEPFDVSARIDAQPADPRPLLRQLELLPAFADDSALSRVAISGDLLLTDRELAFTGLQIELDDSTATGSGKIGLVDGAASTADLRMDRVDLQRYRLAESGSDAAGAAVDGEPFDVARLGAHPFTLNLEINALQVGGRSLQSLVLGARNDASRLTLDRFDTAVDGVPLSVQFTLQHARTPAPVTGRIAFDAINLRQLLQPMGMLPDLSDATALTRVAADLQLSGTDRRPVVEINSLSMDASKISGRIALDRSGTPLAVNATLAIDALDLDRYLPAETDSAVADRSPAADSAPGPAIDLALDIGRLQAAGAPLANVRLELSDRADRLQLRRLAADLFEGKLEASASVDRSQQPESVDLQVRADAIRLQPVLVWLADYEQMSGVADFAFSGSARGLDRDALLGSLAGTGNLAARDLLLRNFNAERSICEAVATVDPNSGSPTAPWSADTRFHDYSSGFTVADGVVQIQQIASGIGNLQVTGNGRVDLAAQNWRANLQATVRGARTSETGCSVNRYLQNTPIPMVCDGSLSDPASNGCRPDSGFLAELAKQALARELANRLLGGSPQPTPAAADAGAAAEESEPPATEPEPEPKKPEEQLLDLLIDRFGR